MINSFSDFASSLVASIIALTIIEMILPNNKIKKYVTFVASIILTIVIINPIVLLVNNDINFENILESEETNFANNEYTAKIEYAKEKSINEMYDEALRRDIINRLEENGYIVKSISVDIDKKTYEPIKMQLEIEHKDGDIQKIVIDVSNNYSDDISNYEVAKVKDFLNSTYNIDRKNIIINNN